VEGQKIYLQPRSMLLAAINDIVELQNGKLTHSDTPHGKIYFTVRMYAARWEFRFSVTDIGDNRCVVEIALDDDTYKREGKLIREFALLDSMLVANAQVELAVKANRA